MIKTFRCKETERIWIGKDSRKLPSTIQNVARRKLRMLNNAVTLDDLRIPPANRLEALKGDRAGQHSIRINAQWRIYFVWQGGNAHDVEIVDYHQEVSCSPTSIPAKYCWKSSYNRWRSARTRWRAPSTCPRDAST